MVQPKAFGGAGRVTLSAKPSLRAAAAAAALPASASDVAVGRRVVGWVAKLKAEGAYIGFLGGLTGFCAVAHLSDAAHRTPHLLAVGQTVAVSVRECEPAKLSDGRTILLSLQPSAVGAAAAALPPDAAAPPGGAIRGLETPMVAAEYDDRWRLASARAAADETEVVVGSTDDEAAEAAAAPAAAAAAALGLTLADDAAAACAAAAAHAAGSAVDLTVEARLLSASACAPPTARRRSPPLSISAGGGPSVGQRCVPSFSTPTR